MVIIKYLAIVIILIYQLQDYQGAYNGRLINNNKLQIVDAAGANQEFLIVVQFTDNSYSSKGLLIRTQSVGSINGFNQLKPNLPQVVSLSSYDSYAAGYYRNLNEARGVLAAHDIGIGSFAPYAPSGTEASITKFLEYPTSDTTNGGAISPAIQ